MKGRENRFVVPPYFAARSHRRPRSVLNKTRKGNGFRFAGRHYLSRIEETFVAATPER